MQSLKTNQRMAFTHYLNKSQHSLVGEKSKYNMDLETANFLGKKWGPDDNTERLPLL